MPQFKYLIVGGGMTAAAAAQGIREIDPHGAIGMITAESHPPYDRPFLSKGLWKGEPVEKIWRDIAKLDVRLIEGREATDIRPLVRNVTDNRGDVHVYQKLLLAVGGTPRRLPFGGDEIIYFRTLDDYEKLRALSERVTRFAVIGGGFIGSEIAAALAMNGRQVVMIVPEEAVGARVFPHDHAAFLNGYYREKGIEVLTSTRADGLVGVGETLTLKVHDTRTSERRDVEVDAVVAGIGIEPNVGLARRSGITVSNGIVVDPGLRTNIPDVFAAGDVASFHSPALREMIRVEHEDNANQMGRAAGRSMAGADVRYDHLPFFYSDMFDLGYEAVGETSSRSETFVDWKDPHREGVIYYLREGRVRGVVLWNVWGQVDNARALIVKGEELRPADLRGRLPV
jgi:NADPH-dependent 2,4-dienoyl-CoA reductase/sulfur reductase-like enzyme